MSRSPILAVLLGIGLFSSAALAQQDAPRRAVSTAKPATGKTNGPPTDAERARTTAISRTIPAKTSAAKTSATKKTANGKTDATAAKAKGKKGKQPVEEVVLPPPPPPRPEQLPPTRPTVTY